MEKKVDLQASIIKEVNDVVIISENIIGCTESKARLIYQKTKENIESGDKFKNYIELFITSLIALLTSDFKEVFGVKILGTIVKFGFIALTIYTFIVAIIVRKKWKKSKDEYNEDGFIKLFTQK